MKSMTGYGKGVAEKDGKELTVELKAVNGRFLEINSRLPKAFAFFDGVLRKAIGKVIKRGTVDVYFSFTDRSADSKPLFIDLQLAGSYVKAAKKLRAEFLLDDDFNLSALMRSPDVLRQDADPEYDEIRGKLLSEAVEKALSALDKMRETEGAALKADLAGIMFDIAAGVQALEKRAPEIVSEYRKKLSERLQKLHETVQFDENRVSQEVAFFADKCDVNEELSRLRSHIAQFNECLKSTGEQGRKLDFISQEMMREANTAGSKSNDVENINTVISIKNNLEKLKEQIRNVE
jgi:uncharacterized protein (TIGR00255 family)